MDDGRERTGWRGDGTSARRLAEITSRVEESQLLERAEPLLARPAAALGRRGRVRSALRGEQLGHALHPLLTDFPLGMWMSANYLDLLGGRRARPAATRLVALGMVSALPTIAAGLVDWQPTEGRARRVGVGHALVNGTAFALYGASLVARLAGAHRRGVALGLAGGVMATAGGYLGGHLSLVHGIGGVGDPPGGYAPADTSRRAEASMGDDKSGEEIGPAEFTKRMPEGEGAGPGSPETLEPRQGHEDPDEGPGGPAMKGLGGSGPEGNETTRHGTGQPTEENRGAR